MLRRLSTEHTQLVVAFSSRARTASCLGMHASVARQFKSARATGTDLFFCGLATIHTGDPAAGESAAWCQLAGYCARLGWLAIYIDGSSNVMSASQLAHDCRMVHASCFMHLVLPKHLLALH